MQDKFWTPELWCEFLNSNPGLPATFQNEVNLFKSSKTKRDWEVVAFRERCGIGIYKLREDGRYRNDNFLDMYGFSLNAMIEDGDIIISVRRLSDDWTVSVKDRVKTMGGRTGIIKSFDATGHILFEDITGLEHITTIQKHPQPILTTVDGVEVTDLTNFFPTVLFEDGSMNVNCDRRTWDNDHARSKGKLFSTREAAEQYILNNKPMLSLNDVKKVCEVNKFYLPVLVERLTALVKQKLNL